ncbi:putative pyruvate kinase [Cyclospora cayetanensis]|uniref:pyruvate kinase n=1 Tax=Cyclospora cayetanensis TaxID=88456 RepID=A0A1D3CW34_9EIME|nr:putative pyruvate kinase [Cyclospora cayetanensis]
MGLGEKGGALGEGDVLLPEIDPMSVAFCIDPHAPAWGEIEVVAQPSAALMPAIIPYLAFQHPIDVGATADSAAEELAPTGTYERNESIEQLYLNGVDVFRLNFSHGLYTEKYQQYCYIKELELKHGKPIAVLADLPGPKLRLGILDPDQQSLQRGQQIFLDAGDSPGAARGGLFRAPLQQQEVLKALRVGHRVLLDDGKINLRVVELSRALMQQAEQDYDESKEEKGENLWVRCIVEIGGPISSKKGVSLPDSTLAISALTKKDKAIAAMVSSWGVDFIALSFVQTAADIYQLRTLLRTAHEAQVQGDPSSWRAMGVPSEAPIGPPPMWGPPHGSHCPALIAKIEKIQALRRLGEIAAAADGLMVARGDLGLELHPGEVPGAQKEIIEAARRTRVPVIVATQMLESMMLNPQPSRAEATDIAAAVFDGADAVMLSGETAASDRGAQIARMQRLILTETERQERLWTHNTLRSPEAARAFAAAAAAADHFAGEGLRRGSLSESATYGSHQEEGSLKDSPGSRPSHASPKVYEAVARGAHVMSQVIGASAILTKSDGGESASILSSLRPRAPIVAAADDPRVARKLQLYWGVQPLFLGASVEGTPVQPGISEGWIDAAKREAREDGFSKSPEDLLVVAGPSKKADAQAGQASDANAAEVQTLSVCLAQGLLQAGIPSTTREGDTRCYAYPLTFGGGPRGGAEGEGRVAVVTGASRGIGLAIAKTFAKGGVETVVCVARDQAACDTAAAELRSLGADSVGYGVDVADGQAVASLCEELLAKYPRIDILVNNAGITRDGLFIRMKEKDWQDVLNTNLNSAYYFSLPIIRRMTQNRFGRIINMASVVGVGGNAGQANYAASKAGLIGFTKSLAKEYANRGITVNAIAPGFIKSEMTDRMTDAAKARIHADADCGRGGTLTEKLSGDFELGAATLASIPAARLGTPQESVSAPSLLRLLTPLRTLLLCFCEVLPIDVLAHSSSSYLSLARSPLQVADLAAFLASDQAAYINGKVIPIDGGMLFGSN